MSIDNKIIKKIKRYLKDHEVEVSPNTVAYAAFNLGIKLTSEQIVEISNSL